MGYRLCRLSVLIACAALTACTSQSEESAAAGAAGTSGYGGSGGGAAGYAGIGGGGGGGGYTGSYDAGLAYDPSTMDAALSDQDAGAVTQEAEVANPFVAVAHDPFSTFAADVDTASYDTFRQGLGYNTLPSATAVRVEDFVNYFDYDYAAPEQSGEHPFEITLTAAPHPTGRGTELLRVAIQAETPVQERKPANLVFLVDTSGSMSAADKLPLVKVLLHSTLDQLMPTDTISIVTYAGTTRVALDTTLASQRATIEAAIDAFDAGGSTNGAGGIQLAYEQAESAMIVGGINHVLLCTDGDFNIGISEPAALDAFISDKRLSGITLTAIGFGRERDSWSDARMETISNNGDGIYGVVYSEDQAVEYANERLLSTLVRVAKDMKIQVEMNPDLVQAYRLIGYENRAIADTDFRNDTVDAGDIGAGHRVTALYEIVRTGGTVPMPVGAPAFETGDAVGGEREIGSGELVRVKVRYKNPGASVSDPAFEVARALLPAEVLTASADAGDDFEWAAAVATLAELLRGSPFATHAELEQVESIVAAQADRDSDRTELGGLLATVRTLLNP